MELEDNFFDLFPDEQRSLYIRCKDDEMVPEFSLFSLGDATG
jgi:hypothetical protein